MLYQLSALFFEGEVMYRRSISRWALGGAAGAGLVIATGALSLATSPNVHADPTVSELLSDAISEVDSANHQLNQALASADTHHGSALTNPDGPEIEWINQQLQFQGEELTFLKGLPAVSAIPAGEETNSTLIFDLEPLANQLLGGLAIMNGTDTTVNFNAELDPLVLGNAVFVGTNAAGDVNDGLIIAENSTVWHGFVDAGLVAGSVPDVAAP